MKKKRKKKKYACARAAIDHVATNAILVTDIVGSVGNGNAASVIVPVSPVEQESLLKLERWFL